MWKSYTPLAITLLALAFAAPEVVYAQKPPPDCGKCKDKNDLEEGDVHSFEDDGAWFECAPNWCHYQDWRYGFCTHFHNPGDDCESGPQDEDVDVAIEAIETANPVRLQALLDRNSDVVLDSSTTALNFLSCDGVVILSMSVPRAMLRVLGS